MACRSVDMGERVMQYVLDRGNQWTVVLSGGTVSPSFLDSQNKTKDPISLRSLIFQQYHSGLHTAVTLKSFCGILECEA